MSTIVASQRLQQVQSQTLTIAPQMRRSLEILQSATLELRDVVLEELQTNPTLEEDSSSASLSLERTIEKQEDGQDDSGEDDRREELDFAQGLEILQKMDEDWKDHFSQENRFQTHTSQDIERRQNFFDSLVSETSLQEHIIEQMKLSDCTQEQRKAMPFIIGSLDDKGFLNMNPQEIAVIAGCKVSIIQETLVFLKNIEPIGLGSKNLQECLLCQLEYKQEKDTLAAKIIRDHFDLLLRRRLQDISKKTGVSLSRIQEAIAVIAKLDPAPGRRFSEDNNRSVLADIIVEKDIHGQWTVSLNSDYIPRLRISPVYKQLLFKNTLSISEKEYLKTKMQSGNFLIQAIEQRQQTVEKIAKLVVELQKAFFENGLKYLLPLTMGVVAQKIGVHETTVSRAIANKYMQTPHGLFEMKFFFTSGYALDTGENIANTSIKDQIGDIIATENPAKPYSDQKLVEILKEKNINIARRTVAKYREELKILPTHLRRQY